MQIRSNIRQRVVLKSLNKVAHQNVGHAASTHVIANANTANNVTASNSVAHTHNARIKRLLQQPLRIIHKVVGIMTITIQAVKVS